MNKRKSKKLRKKLDMFVTSFARSYREVREHDRQYHEFVVADKRSRRNKEECYDFEFVFELTPEEIYNIFGTTNIAAFIGMSDEEIDRIVDKWNSIPN